MSDVTALAPILSGRGDDHVRFCREIEVRRAEHDASRRRHGITMERIFVQTLPEAAVALTHLQGPGADSLLVDLAVSLDAYDRWFLAQIEWLHGIDVRVRVPPAPDLVRSIVTDAPVNGKSFACAVPLAHENLEDWKAFQRLVISRRVEQRAMLERMGVAKETVHLAPTRLGLYALLYFEGIDRLAGSPLWTSEHPFARWYVGNLDSLHGIDFARFAAHLDVTLRLEWRLGAAPATQVAVPRF